jgi:hypothetical protein
MTVKIIDSRAEWPEMHITEKQDHACKGLLANRTAGLLILASGCRHRAASAVQITRSLYFQIVLHS